MPNKDRIIRFAILFGLIMGILSSWLGPKVIAWYFDPPVNIGVNCREAVEWAMAKLELVILLSIGVGTLLGAVVGMRGKKPSEQTPSH